MASADHTSDTRVNACMGVLILPAYEDQWIVIRKRNPYILITVQRNPNFFNNCKTEYHNITETDK
jgi:hypothetical protein